MVSPPVAATVAPPVLAAMAVLVAMLDQARLVMVLRARPPVLRPTPVRSWRAPRAAMAARVVPEAMVEPVALPVVVARTAVVATLALPATVALVAPAARVAQLVPVGVLVAPVRRAARGEVLVPGSALLPPTARLATTATAATAVTAATPRMPLDPPRVAKEARVARLPRPVEMVVRVDRVVPPIQLVASPPRVVWAALVVHLQLATPAAVVPAVRRRSAAGRRQRRVARVPLEARRRPETVVAVAPVALHSLAPRGRRHRVAMARRAVRPLAQVWAESVVPGVPPRQPWPGSVRSARRAAMAPTAATRPLELAVRVVPAAVLQQRPLAHRRRSVETAEPVVPVSWAVLAGTAVPRSSTAMRRA